MLEEKGAPTEFISFEQFTQEIIGEEMHLHPEDRPSPLPQDRKLVGKELQKQRIRLSFDFDVTCNDGPITDPRDSIGEAQDRALLKSFLVADQDRLQDLLAQCAAIELGLWSCETFIEMFLGQLDYRNGAFERRLFNPAIDALEGNAGEYWRAIRESDALPWGDVLSLATESIFDCFEATFVQSQYEVVPE